MNLRLGMAIGATLLLAGCGRHVTVYVYGTGGELLSRQNTSEPAAGATPVSGEQTEMTNALLPDGVLMLAQKYSEFSFLTGAVATF